jgi:cysteine-rich repeat protein
MIGALLLAMHPAQAQVCVLRERQKVTAPDAEPLDRFGSAVSTDGARAIVGAWYDDDETGSAYMYTRDDNGTEFDSWDDTWVSEGKITASDGTIWDRFGISLSIYGDRAIVGAPSSEGEAIGSGSAYVFRRDGSWVQEAKLTASDGGRGDSFGSVVSISGDTAIVGAPRHDGVGNLSGAVYVFRRVSSWRQEAKLTASDAAADDHFGTTVFIDGDRLVVGAPSANNGVGAYSGSAYVFRHDDNGTPLYPYDDFWIEEAKLTASDADAGDTFGRSVSIAGDRVAVGAPGVDFLGAVYIFKRDDDAPGNWVEEAKLTASEGEAGDEFGASVAISGDAVVVGAYAHDGLGSSAGSAYLFRSDDNGTPFDPIDDVWIEEANFHASDTYTYDRFGSSVALGDVWAVVGAYGDDDDGLGSGSAYLFDTGDCAIQLCGDSLIMGVEGCDDGNTVNGDGCSAACAVESGWDCTGEPSTCTFHCGDAVIGASEECDDGNEVRGDGCFVDCTVEIGWTCAGQPSVCTELMDPQIRWNPVSASGNVFCTPGTPPCRRTELMLIKGGVTATLFMQVSGWDWDQDGEPTLGAFQGTLDSATLTGRYAHGVNTLPGVDLTTVGWTTPQYQDAAFQAMMVCSDDYFEVDMTDPAIALSHCTGPGDCPSDYPYCVERPDYVFYGSQHFSDVWIYGNYDYAWLGASLGCPADPDGGATKFYAGTLLVDVPHAAQGTYNIRFIDHPQLSMFSDCVNRLIEGVVALPGQITIPSGRCCSSIGVGSTACESGVYATECDTRPGPRAFSPLETCSGSEVPDCNANGIPDDCDVMAGDCNNNGTPDECDVDSGRSEDCNGNAIPDDCDIGSGTSEDFDVNGIPDECDIVAGDCNDNGIPDEREPDSDADGVIDECDGCPEDSNKIEPGECGCGVDDNADSDSDGVPDCVDQCPGVDDDLFAPSCAGIIPTASAWGMIVLTLLLLAAGKVYFTRRLC